jgi:hypothetical protein
MIQLDLKDPAHPRESLSDEPYPNSIIPDLDPSTVAEFQVAEPPEDAQSGFWRRQFKGDPTAGQKKFDTFVGLFLPCVCFLFDPVVFKADHGILHRVSVFAYVGSYAAVMGTAAWILWGKRLSVVAAPLSGLFAAASLFSFLLGLVLLPFSLIGLFFYFVGALGFTPLLFSFVLLRNSIRVRSCMTHTADGQPRATFILAVLVSILVPVLLNEWLLRV